MKVSLCETMKSICTAVQGWGPTQQRYCAHHAHTMHALMSDTTKSGLSTHDCHFRPRSASFLPCTNSRHHHV